MKKKLTYKAKVKMNTLSKIAVYAIGYFLISFSSYSQKATYNNPQHGNENLMGLKQGWFVGIDGGTTLFYGDVSLFNVFPKTYDVFKKSAGTGYSLFGGKKFKFGLSAELQLFKGTLKGEKVSGNLYPRYFNSDLYGYSVSAKYNLSNRLFREQNARKFFNRLTLYANVGAGQIFFRSRLYKLAVNEQWYLEKTSGFEDEGIDSAGISTAGGLVTDKAKTISAITLPVGGKINFKLNAKTDVVLDILYVTAFSDKLDSWTRNWSHKDRYLYTGLGLVYNIGSDNDDDIPSKDRLFMPKNKKSKKTSENNDDSEDDAYEKDSSNKSSDGLKGLFSAKKGKGKKEDKDLEIKLKLYELQLKLFEMQYMLQD